LRAGNCFFLQDYLEVVPLSVDYLFSCGNNLTNEISVRISLHRHLSHPGDSTWWREGSCASPFGCLLPSSPLILIGVEHLSKFKVSIWVLTGRNNIRSVIPPSSRCEHVEILKN